MGSYPPSHAVPAFLATYAPSQDFILRRSDYRM
jgi:hypothetical protein